MRYTKKSIGVMSLWQMETKLLPSAGENQAERKKRKKAHYA